MGNLSLYQITNAFPELLEIEDITEEDREKIRKELTELLQNKSKNIIGFVRNQELTIEAMKEEEKRIAESRKRLENKLSNFKDYVKECMTNNNLLKIETEIGTISLAKSPISVEVTNEEIIPEEFKTIVTSIKIDKKKIADNFKATGEIPDGTIIHTGNKSIRIK